MIDFEQYLTKSKEYISYIQEHKQNVKKSFEELKEVIRKERDLSDSEFKKLKELIDTHDDSKWNDTEFFPYLEYFYVYDYLDEDVEKKYKYAWLRHIHNNPHHWQYWVLHNDEEHMEALDMSKIFVFEMLCDWHSFSYKNPESTANHWYKKNKDKMILSKNTRDLVEKYLKLKPEF